VRADTTSMVISERGLRRGSGARDGCTSGVLLIFKGWRSCVLRIAFSFVHVDVGFILAGWDAGASVELGTSRQEDGMCRSTRNGRSSPAPALRGLFFFLRMDGDWKCIGSCQFVVRDLAICCVSIRRLLGLST
jgi:hypothetical protein